MNLQVAGSGGAAACGLWREVICLSRRSPFCPGWWPAESPSMTGLPPIFTSLLLPYANTSHARDMKGAGTGPAGAAGGLRHMSGNAAIALLALALAAISIEFGQTLLMEKLPR